MKWSQLGIFAATAAVSMLAFGIQAVGQQGADAGQPADTDQPEIDQRTDAGQPADTDERADRQYKMMERQLEARLNRLDEQLDLSDEQVEQLRAVYESYYREIRDARETLSQQVETATEQKDENVREILTDQQLETLREMRRTEAKRWFDQRLEQIKSELELTDQQTQKIEQIYQQTRQDIEEVYANEKLGQQARHRRIRRLFEDARERVRDALTREQRQKLEDLRREKRRPDRGARPGRQEPKDDADAGQ